MAAVADAPEPESVDVSHELLWKNLCCGKPEASEERNSRA